MKKFRATNSFIIILFCLFIFTGCAKKDNENEQNNNKSNVDTSILDKTPIYYSANEKSWKDFEWLAQVTEYPEPEKIVGFDFQEGDFINVYYENADLKKVKAWANQLLEEGFYENKLDEELEEYIAIKRRNLDLDLRFNPYYYFKTKKLTIFVSRTEYQREVQDAQWELQQQEKN